MISLSRMYALGGPIGTTHWLTLYCLTSSGTRFIRGWAQLTQRANLKFLRKYRIGNMFSLQLHKHLGIKSYGQLSCKSTKIAWFINSYPAFITLVALNTVIKFYYYYTSVLSSKKTSWRTRIDIVLKYMLPITIVLYWRMRIYIKRVKPKYTIINTLTAYGVE